MRARATLVFEGRTLGAAWLRLFFGAPDGSGQSQIVATEIIRKHSIRRFRNRKSPIEQLVVRKAGDGCRHNCAAARFACVLNVAPCDGAQLLIAPAVLPALIRRRPRQRRIHQPNFLRPVPRRTQRAPECSWMRATRGPIFQAGHCN
jgi:hypothetical protein